MTHIGRPKKSASNKVQSNGFTPNQWAQITEEAQHRTLSYTALLREAWDYYYAHLCADRAKAGNFDTLPPVQQPELFHT